MSKNKKGVPTYNYTMKQIEDTYMKGYNKGKEDSFNKACEYALTVSIMALRDTWDFGGQRIEEFIDAVSDLYDSIDQGYLDINDIIETIEEETQVQIIRGQK